MFLNLDAATMSVRIGSSGWNATHAGTTCVPIRDLRRSCATLSYRVWLAPRIVAPAGDANGDLTPDGRTSCRMDEPRGTTVCARADGRCRASACDGAKQVSWYCAPALWTFEVPQLVAADRGWSRPNAPVLARTCKKFRNRRPRSASSGG